MNQKYDISLTKRELEFKYNIEKKPISTIAEECNVPYHTINRWLRHYNIKKYDNITTIEKEQLYDLYINKKNTIKDIAKSYNTTPYRIRLLLEYYKICTLTNKDRWEDLTNKEYDQLTVICLYSETQTKHGLVRKWLCKCKCGKTTIVRGNNLTNGNTTRCRAAIHRSGNLSKKWTGYGEISGQKWSSIKKAAKDRNLDFDITIEYAWNLFLEQEMKCALSGMLLTMDLGTTKNRLRYGTASLDRKDSTKGYTENNVQWVHKWINIMKQDMTDDEFIGYCHTISDFQRGKNEKASA